MQNIICKVFTVLLFCLSQLVHAEQLPTSTAGPEGSWRKMNKNAYDSGERGLDQQCWNMANMNDTDPMHLEHCDELKQAYRAGKYEVKQVQNGSIVVDILSGLDRGKPHLYLRMLKYIGDDVKRTDRALLFRLSNNVNVYYFTGATNSCNNLAVVFTAPVVVPPPAKEVARKAPPPESHVTVFQRNTGVVQDDVLFVLSNVSDSRSCCCVGRNVVGNTLIIGNSPTLTSSGDNQVVR